MSGQTWQVVGEYLTPAGAIGIVGPNGEEIACVFEGPNQAANACLIAAAPKLYESLKTIVMMLRSGNWGEGSGEFEEGELQLAEAIIVAALGE